MFIYGLITLFAFSLWSFSTALDLPLNKIITSSKYDRYYLTRAYIFSRNQIASSDNIIPSKQFKENWDAIDDRENKSLPFLFNAPSIYGYFMTHGILVNNINQSDIFDSEDHSFTCLKIDTDENSTEM